MTVQTQGHGGANTDTCTYTQGTDQLLKSWSGFAKNNRALAEQLPFGKEMHECVSESIFPHHWILLPLCEMDYSDISASREPVWLQVEAVAQRGCQYRICFPINH